MEMTPLSMLYGAVSLLIITLLTAQSLTPNPIQRLGKRPLGSGLLTYLYSQLFSTYPGCWGYDSSLGSFNPIWRLIFHICSIMVLSSVMLKMFIGSYNKDDASFIIVIFRACVLYSTSIGLYWTFGNGVSKPGGPREHKIRRMPKWDDKNTIVEGVFRGKNNNNTSTASLSSLTNSSFGRNWRCAVAQDSHRATLKQFNLDPKTHGENGINENTIGLNGEPFGRQMWTSEPRTIMEDDSNNYNEDDDDDEGWTKVNPHMDLIQTFAKGGRKEYTFNPSQNPNSADFIFRQQMITNYVANGGTLPNVNEKCQSVKDAMKKAVHFYSMLQTEDGHWAGDYGGPHFLMPGLIITWYVMGKPSLMLNEEQCAFMAHYLKVHQQADGGWGTHIESPSTMFGTTLCYVSLRLLGVDANDKDMLRGKAFIQSQGGVIMTSSWAKFWLCILGCMEWEGHNSVPAEMWLLPNWFPFHPGRLWCHCRMVYLPMGYLYGSRFVYDKAETDDLILSLRKELYVEEYDSIPWMKTRHLIAPMDNYSPIPFVMEFLQNGLARYESWFIFQPFKNFVRKMGLAFSKDYMAAEDLQTNFIDIGPVNKVMNMLSAYHAANGDINHHTVQNHMMRVADYLWLAEDGMKMQGYNGSQCWDTSFAIQAISECDLMDEFPAMSKKVWAYFERTQILSTEVSQASPAYEYESYENRNKYYRHVSKGGWPFSTSAHGWPISDCTGEALKGVIVLLKSESVQKAVKDGSLKDINETRLQEAVNVILTLQNEDGGWATYENNRGFGWYEQLNPSEVFGDIMIDYSYAECSMASLTALADFHKLYPHHRTEEVVYSIEQGKKFFESIQRPDGSWYGSWACCFCYGCWFGIEGLIKAGKEPTCPAIIKCCDFLLSKQRANGGWGEDFTSCYDKDYAENGMDSYGDEGSGVVNTAWALLALSEAKCDNVDAVKRGVQYLLKRQLSSGDWPQEGISGVFNRACGITYTAYRNIFPIWALGRCRETYGDAIEN